MTFASIILLGTRQVADTLCSLTLQQAFEFSVVIYTLFLEEEPEAARDTMISTLVPAFGRIESTDGSGDLAEGHSSLRQTVSSPYS